MAYSDTLTKIIQKSGLTPEQIVMQFKVFGVDISGSDIGNLQAGTQAPPSDQVSEAIAQVCDADPDVLIYEGCLETVPDSVRDLLLGVSNMALQLTKELTRVRLPSAIASMVEDRLDEVPDIELIKQFLQIDPAHIIKYDDDGDNTCTLNRFATLPMPDAALEPWIPVQSKLELTKATTLQNGDVVVANTEANTYVVRRYFRNGDVIALIPEHPGFEPMMFPANDVPPLAKVKTATIDV